MSLWELVNHSQHKKKKKELSHVSETLHWIGDNAVQPSLQIDAIISNVMLGWARAGPKPSQNGERWDLLLWEWQSEVTPHFWEEFLTSSLAALSLPASPAVARLPFQAASINTKRAKLFALSRGSQQMPGVPLPGASTAFWHLDSIFAKFQPTLHHLWGCLSFSSSWRNSEELDPSSPPNLNGPSKI